MSGKDTWALTEEWPFLFSLALASMKAHFKLLTGVHINVGFEEAMTTKLYLNMFSLVHWKNQE